jgi:membrane associated rhomboid family serine protease
MSTSDIDTRPGESDEVTYCYGHPKTPTKLRCSRCDRPICGRCAIPAPVGQHCPECVAEARKSRPKVRAALQANAPAVYALLAINIVMYVAQQVSPRVTFELAMIPQLVDSGEWYRLITAMFLHAGLWHIGFNMYALYLFGPTIEQAFGTRRFVAMYFVAGLAGSAASFAFPPHVPSLGASGAIFGILGVMLVYLYNRRTQTFIGHYLRNLLGLLAINFAIGFLPGLNIDWVAHLGGLIGGMALGYGFDRGVGAAAKSPPALQLASLLVVFGVSAFLVMAGPFGT